MTTLPPENTVALSRVIIPLLGLVVWGCFYKNAKCAYRLPRSRRKTASQLFFVFGAVAIFILQVNLMELLSPKDAHGIYFFNFIMIECGGALAVLFYTLIREKAKKQREWLNRPSNQPK
jgi:hypothetical protein